MLNPLESQPHQSFPKSAIPHFTHKTSLGSINMGLGTAASPDDDDDDDSTSKDTPNALNLFPARGSSAI